MKAALLAATLLLATPAFALFGTTLRVEVRDALDRPAADGFVFAREIGYIGKLHGSTRVCLRAGAAMVAGGTAKLHWPLPPVRTILAGLQRIELVAYRPGHCSSLATDWGSGVVMHLPPAPQAVDERLFYIHELTASLACDDGSWGGDSVAAIERLAMVLEEEMRPLAREPFERQVAERVRANLRRARARIVGEDPGVPPRSATPGFSRDFVVVPGNSPTRWDDRSGTWILGIPQSPPQTSVLAAPRGSQPGNAVAVAGGDFTWRPVGPPIEALEPVVLRCRHGEPSACKMDQRDSLGETALGSAISRLRTDEVKLLLAAGADPAVRTTPAGEPAIDILLRRMTRTSPNHGESDRALEILALLAAHPKVAISRWLKQDLASDPSQWHSLRNTMGEGLFVRARATLAALPERADEVRCARPNPMGFDSTLRPFHLR